MLYTNNILRYITWDNTLVGYNIITNSDGSLYQYKSVNVLSTSKDKPIHFFEGEIIKSNWSVVKMQVFKYDGYSWSTTGWITDDYIIPYDGSYVFCFTTRPEEEMTEDIADNILTNIFIYTNQRYKPIVYKNNLVWYNLINGLLRGDGILGSAESFNEVCTGFIRVYKDSIVKYESNVVNKTVNPWIRVCRYNNDGTFIEQESYSINSNGITHIINNYNDGLIRISWRNIDNPNVSIFYLDKKDNKNHEFASLFARLSGRKFLHAGSRLAPSNSIPSFRIAGEKGSFGIETDANLTKDGEIVMSHEPTIKDAYNYYGDLTISEMTLSELREYRRLTNDSYADEELVIPTIEDTLQICRQYDMLCIFDVKVFSNISIFCDKMIDTIYKYNMQNAVIILCWNNDLLKYIKNKYPLIPISTYGYNSLFDDSTENVVISDEFIISDKNTFNDKIKELHSKGYLVNLFTANTTEDEQSMKEVLADMITTNITHNNV